MSSGSQCVVEDGYLRHENSFTWHNETPIDLDDTTGLVSPIIVKALEQSVMNHLATKNFGFVARNDDAPSDQWSDVDRDYAESATRAECSRNISIGL